HGPRRCFPTRRSSDLSLTVADAAGDDFDEATVIWIDEGDLGFDSGTDANQAYIDGLAPGVTVRVFVVSDIGLGNADGDVDGASLGRKSTRLNSSHVKI